MEYVPYGYSLNGRSYFGAVTRMFSRDFENTAPASYSLLKRM